MIARIWRGWTSPANADAYEALLTERILPGIAAREIEGYRGAHLLRDDRDGESEFVTILWFDSIEAVRDRFDEASDHYDVIRDPGADASGDGR